MDNKFILNDSLKDKLNKKPKNSFLGGIFKLLITIGIFISLIFYFSYSNFVSSNILNENKIIEFNSGDTFYSLSNKLGINKLNLKIYLKYNKPDFTLQAGKYEIHKDKNIVEILNNLKNPIIEENAIIILEGWNIYDIDDYLGGIKLINYGDFIKESKKINKYSNNFAFLEGKKTLEGYLYPDTYKINPNNFNLEKLTNKILSNFKNKINNIKYNDLILASILEKEEKNKDELKVVAGILIKRLKENWFIGADATVCYPYKLTYKECNPKFIGEHIRDKNDYNLRTKTGLPPTPIGNPSIYSIEAILKPTKTKYYYYLHDNNGKIHYAVSNDEHVKNKRKYLWK